MPLGPFDSEIFPIVVVLKQLDTAATESAGAYNHVMREPILVDTDGDGIGEYPSELYASETKVPGQLESNSTELFNMMSGGNLPESNIFVSFSRGRLEMLGLMDTDGRPKIKTGDRWVRAEDMAGNVMWTFNRPDAGLVCEEIRMSDAFIGGRSNWFLATFKSRKVGPTL